MSVSFPKAGLLVACLLGSLGGWRLGAAPVTAPPSPDTPVVLILATNGLVEVLRSGAQTWDFASPLPEKNRLHPGDQLRIGPGSHARVQLADRTIMPVGPNGHLRVLQPVQAGAAVRLLRGLFFFLHRDEPGQVEVLTPTVSAVIRGTEFTVEVAPDGSTSLHLMDGAVRLTNELGGLELKSGEAAIVRPGEAPGPAPMLEGVQAIQWCLYYPGVLFLGDLGLTDAERARLIDSLAAYQVGDLRTAFSRHPETPTPDSDATWIYLATLRLGVGDVSGAQAAMGQVQASGSSGSLTSALRRLIAAVVGLDDGPALKEGPATAWLAESYYQQARSNLEAARAAARAAVSAAPEFGFARTRLAELEFGFGRIEVARRELEQGLQRSPRNPRAWALRGFLLAAENHRDEAQAAFDEAIALDSGLGDAWLGRGLIRLARGDRTAGRRDMEVAAAVEPQRAILRSYLGKAFAEEHDPIRAVHELELARQIDPLDPTAWLYSALLNRDANRINQAIRDLETSRRLNDNRTIYRSRFLLDQDQAVRGANLAAIYQDAGFDEVALQTAARAVEEDYGNFSSHLFLANSQVTLRDPGQVDLRAETPWFSEYLVANLLAPPEAGTLSPTVSDQEYSRLFARNRLGVVAQSEYRSGGDWLVGGAQYGVWDGLAYSIEGFYRKENGHRPNNDLERRTLSFQAKQAITARDTLFFQAITLAGESGDRARYYDEDDANPGLRLTERQEPLLLAGYHREWAPGQHTIALAARLHNDLSVQNPTLPVDLRYFTNGGLSYVDVIEQDLRYHSELEIYSAELQQILTRDPFRLIVGTRGQFGEFRTRNEMPGFFFVPATVETVSADFHRWNAHAYLHWQPFESLQLIGGLAGDELRYPQNFRSPPLTAGEETVRQLSPKAGLIWKPGASTVVRGAFARALGGVSFDQSFQLEPSRIAGFLQTYRSLLPESAAGSVAGASFETWGLALEHQFPTETYVGVSGEWLRSDATRQAGVFDANEVEIAPGVSQINVEAASMPENLDFTERSLTVYLNQLIGGDFALGARYKVSRASFESRFTEVGPSVPSFGGFERVQDQEGILHELRLYGLVQHASGFFGGVDSVWRAQSNSGYSPARPGDDFWQFNVHAGWRWWQRRLEARISLLNLTDRDYRLNPLNFATELPHERTLALSVRLSF